MRMSKFFMKFLNVYVVHVYLIPVTAFNTWVDSSVIVLPFFAWPAWYTWKETEVVCQMDVAM